MNILRIIRRCQCECVLTDSKSTHHTGWFEVIDALLLIVWSVSTIDRAPPAQFLSASSSSSSALPWRRMICLQYGYELLPQWRSQDGWHDWCHRSKSNLKQQPISSPPTWITSGPVVPIISHLPCIVIHAVQNFWCSWRWNRNQFRLRASCMYWYFFYFCSWWWEKSEY